MAFFGLKLGLDLSVRAAPPPQKFQGVPPPPGYEVDPFSLEQLTDSTFNRSLRLFMQIYKADYSTLSKHNRLLYLYI